MRAVLTHTSLALAVTIMMSGVSEAQSSDPPAATDALATGLSLPPVPSSALLFAQQPIAPLTENEAVPAPSAFTLSPPPSLDSDARFAQQPAGPPPTPRHTGIKAMSRHLVTNFKYLPSKENLLWAGAGGGLALAAHPFDDDVNRELVGNDTAENIFKTGEILRSEERRVGK